MKKEDFSDFKYLKPNKEKVQLKFISWTYVICQEFFLAIDRLINIAIRSQIIQVSPLVIS